MPSSPKINNNKLGNPYCIPTYSSKAYSLTK
jgi:hypothetical protein